MPKSRYNDGEYNPFQMQTNARRVSSHGGKRRKKKKKSAFKRICVTVAAMLLCALLGLIVRGNVVGLIRVHGDAMGDTLPDGALVLVKKNEFTRDSASPERGDVVAIDTQDGILIRRVVGLPEEEIAWNGMGDVTANGEAVRGAYVQNSDYTIYDSVTLPVGRYYVLCDNRANTCDSRDPSIGKVEKHDIEGRVLFVLWPLSSFGAF